MSDADERLRRWLAALVTTPGLTSIRDPAEAWRVHVEQSRVALPAVRTCAGPIVDVGSGGGAPGIPLAVELPERQVVLLEAAERKADFLRAATADLENVSVIRGRAEEQEPERYGVAVAKALAPVPVALEWCLPLVRKGGAVVLCAGPPDDPVQAARVAELLGGSAPEAADGVVIVRKVAATPAGFPRRPGMARKRPLA